MSDLASGAAATSAGYQLVQTDRGASVTPRYTSRYERTMAGELGEDTWLLKAEGSSNVSQAAADAQALAVLNGQRTVRYGAASTAGKGGKGSTLTFDVH